MAVITWKTDEEIRNEEIEKKWTNIKAERDKRQQEGGYQALGHWFHSDNSSRIQQMRLEEKAKQVLAGRGTEEDVLEISGQPVLWKTMDGSFVPMTAGLALEIGRSAEATEAALFQMAEQHNAAMRQLANPTAYDFFVGWPLAYWEVSA